MNRRNEPPRGMGLGHRAVLGAGALLVTLVHVWACTWALVPFVTADVHVSGQGQERTPEQLQALRMSPPCKDLTTSQARADVEAWQDALEELVETASQSACDEVTERIYEVIRRHQSLGDRIDTIGHCPQFWDTLRENRAHTGRRLERAEHVVIGHCDRPDLYQLVLEVVRVEPEVNPHTGEPAGGGPMPRVPP